MKKKPLSQKTVGGPSLSHVVKKATRSSTSRTYDPRGFSEGKERASHSAGTCIGTSAQNREGS